MPNLKELLAKAKADDAAKSKGPLTRGIRPDMMITDSSTNKDHDENRNVARTQPERRDVGGQNVEITKPYRSQNAAVKIETQPERRDKGGQNAAIEILSQESDPTLLVGTQRHVFKYFFELAQKFASLKTPRLTLDSMSASTGLRETQIHSATKQLRQKGCIIISSRKDGRGGWVEYAVTQSAFDLWIRLENQHKRSQNEAGTESERSQQPGHKAIHEAPSSSRDLYIKNTTTTSDVEKFEFKLDQVSEFGLTASAVSRCFELYPNLENEKMQDLLNRFAQFMRSGDGKRIQNARGFFISLAEQMSKGMTPLDHIETAEAILIRELVSKRRAQKAEQDSLEKEIQDFDFEDWWSELLPQDRDLLVPPNNIALPGSSSQKLIAKQVHAEKFWPERRVRVLQEASPDI